MDETIRKSICCVNEIMTTTHERWSAKKILDKRNKYSYKCLKQMFEIL